MILINHAFKHLLMQIFIKLLITSAIGINWLREIRYMIDALYNAVIYDSIVFNISQYNLRRIITSHLYILCKKKTREEGQSTL